MKLARASDVLHRVGPDYLVLARPSGAVLEVGGTGWLVWEGLREPTELDTLVSQVASTCAADRAEIEEDVKTLLELLTAEGYVEQG